MKPCRLFNTVIVLLVTLAATEVVTGCNTPKNRKPSVFPMSITTTEDKGVIITLKGFDPDEEDALKFTVTKKPQHGKLTGKAPDLLYIPDSNFFGQDSLKFVATDGKATTDEATVEIAVKHVNHKPTADSKKVELDQNRYANIILSGSDADDDKLTFVITKNPKHGSLSGKTPKLVYTPDVDFYGFDTFEYIAKDGHDQSLEAYVHLFVKEQPFLIRIKTDNNGSTDNKSFAIPVNGGGYDYRVDCNNDGIDEKTGINGIYICSYKKPGIYTISIKGSFPQIYFDNRGDKSKLLAILGWSTHRWRSFKNAFKGCDNMDLKTSSSPNLSITRDISSMFDGATKFNGKIEGWDTNNIIDMNATLQGTVNFTDHNLSEWDTGNVDSHENFCHNWGAGNIPPDNWICD